MKRLAELQDRDRVAMIREQALAEARAREEEKRAARRDAIALAVPSRPIPRRFEFPWMPIFAGLIFVLSIVLCTTGAVTWFRWIAAAIR